MNPADRTKLQRILASFDEAGLIALANKGLVRRAQKDLEAGGVTADESDAAVLVRGPGWEVTMPPDGPARATDSTRATGVTRQILMATIYLRDHWAAGAAPVEASPAEADGVREALLEALRAIDLDDLDQWAGKTTVDEALRLVRTGLAVEVETHAGITLRLVGHEIEARLLPGKRGKSAGSLLDAILCTAPRTQHKRWVTAAVLAYRQSQGQVIDRPKSTAPAEAEGAPLDRQQLVAAAQDLLAGMTATGLAHPSERMVERLFTLSISAGAIHLPRLARLLRSLADDVALVLGRSAAADTGRLFDRLCLAHALARGLAAPQPPAGLAGTPRTRYDPAGDLALSGVGAHAWQTASGYEGLTVLFWEGAARRFLTWTASRPLANAGRLGMAQTYRHEVVWSGSSPERLSRSRFTLRQARFNPQGRLSTAGGAAVADLSAADASALDFGDRRFTQWAALRDYARTTYPVGLTEVGPLERIVVLEPAAWGARSFDELRQRFCWHVHDGAGDVLALTLPWAGVHEQSIAFLEAVKPDRDLLRSVVAQLVHDGGGLLIEPLALLREGPDAVLNPAFDHERIASRQSALLDRLRHKFGRDRVTTTIGADDEDGEAEALGNDDRLPPALRGRLAEAEGLLLEIAESGLRRLREPMRARLRPLAAALDRLGLAELGGALAALEQPAQVVQCGYLCRLHRQVLAATLG